MAITFSKEKDRKFIVREIILDEETIDTLWQINVRNRNRNKTRETVYANSMMEERWVFDNPNSMCFTVNASYTWLLDGQTRLASLRQSRTFGKHALLFIVPDEMAELVFRTMDLGRLRTCGATLAALGITNATRNSAILTALLKYVEKDGYFDPAMTNEMVPSMAPIFQKLPTGAHKVSKKKPPCYVFAGLLNALRLSLITMDQMAELANQAMLDKGDEKDPSRQLSRTMIALSGQARQADARDIIGLVTELAHRYATGENSTRALNGEKQKAKYEELYRVPKPSVSSLVELAEMYAVNNAATTKQP